MSHNKDVYLADYVIIGGGTAANTLARLLSDDKKTSVLVIEAGENASRDPVIRDSRYTEIQFGLEENFYPAYFWQHASVPDGRIVKTTAENTICVNCTPLVDPLLEEHEEEEEGGHGGHGGDQYTTGRLLGGGSSINGQQWVRGSLSYWNKINSLLGDIWSPRKILKRYKKIEKYLGISDHPETRGHCGYVNIRQAPVFPTTTITKFVQAVQTATGLPEIVDYNDPATPVGPFSRWQLTQKPNGSRESSDTAFLFPCAIDQKGNGLDGRKLKVFFKTTALRIIFDGKTAVGVTALRNGNWIQLNAKKKVIVSAGVYSAEILQRSGVGPAPLLKCLGIPLVADNRFIGQNLQNQLILPITFSANTQDEGLSQQDPLSLYTGGAFLPAITQGLDLTIRGYQLIGASPAPGIFSIIIAPLQPQSLGVVRVQSQDPLTISLVDNNYLGNDIDVQQFIDVIRTYITKIADALAAIDPSYQLISPTLEVINNDHLLGHFIRDNIDHTHHWVGTNAMSRCPKSGAVDPTGHVYGTKDLIVADASILPIISDGNTQAPAYLVGYTIAELLKDD